MDSSLSHRGLGGLNAFYWYQIFALDSAVVEAQEMVSSSIFIILIININFRSWIFVVGQLQEKYLAVNKRLYIAFLDLEKAFERVPLKVYGGALESLVLSNGLYR